MADGSASGPGPARPVAAAVAGWAKALSEVGGPNTLLWAPDHPGGYLDLTTAHPGGVSRLLAGRVTHLSDLVREPGALAEALAVTRELHDRTRALEERRGLVSCLVAVGMATWDPPRPGASVAAPVLLRGCRLRPTTPAAEDFHVDLSSSVEVNPVLVHYLSSMAGISVDPQQLADLARVHSRFDPYPVYAVLRQSCSAMPGFTIRPRLVLGSYPYAKLPMVADLTENSGPLVQADLVAALAGDPDARARLAVPLPDVDPDPDPSGEVLVLDADAVQGSVVEAVRAGRSLVVSAPHGTGSTQTVADLVAALAHDGLRTLVVTPYPATIADLVDRLATVQLGDLVLDLTGAGSDRHTLAARLGERLSSVSDDDSSVPDPMERQQRELHVGQARRRLADHVEALHTSREPWGVSIFQIQSAMAVLGSATPAPASRVRIRGGALRELRRDTVEELTGELRRAVQAGAWSDDPTGDPWYGAQITTGDEVAQASDIVTRLAGGGFVGSTEVLGGILAESGLPPARCVGDWETALDTMQGVRDTLEIFRPEIFDVPLDEHLVATGSRRYRASAAVQLGLLARSRVRRQAKWLLRPGRPPADLHAELRSAQEQRQAWHRLVGAGGRPEISPRLDEAQQILDALRADLTWLGERLLGGGADDVLHVPLPRLHDQLGRLAGRLDRLEVLPAVSPTLAQLQQTGMGEVVDDFARRGVSAEQVRPELEYLWWASLLLEITENDPRCGEHDGPSLHETAHRFRVLDRQQRDDTARLVRAAVTERAHQQLRAAAVQSELLRAQAAGERRPLPFSDVFRECADVLAALHPCLALSPYAVGELLPPGICFDVVVVQDASSVTSAEVVSALSRGRSAVIVGDPAGVRPASFAVSPPPPATTAAAHPDVAAGGGGPASVLEDVRSLLPQRRLTWRHGGVDARLGGSGTPIELGVPAAAVRPAVRLERIDRSGPDGNASVSAGTADLVARIVELVVDHARTASGRSLAVVALCPVLGDQVREALRRALDDLADRDRFDPALAFFDPARREPLVVSDLDTAYAGRDVLVVGVGDTCPPHGPGGHRFAELAAADAAQRLAGVASLAREQLVVVGSSLSADDLAATRLESPGMTALRELLAFAERAGRPADEPRRGQLDPLLADLASRLTREGLVARAQVGPGRYPVELAVTRRGDAERFLVAVETDGAEYAALPGVRERERLRVEQLQRLGWAPLRVWTTDLFRDPVREVARVLEAVRRARPGTGPTPDAGTEQPEVRISPASPAQSAAAGRIGENAPASGVDRTAATSRVDPTAADLQVEQGPSRHASPAPRRDSAGASSPLEPESTGKAAPAPRPESTGPADSGQDGEASRPAATVDTSGGRRRLRWRRGRAGGDLDSNWDEFFDADARDRWLREQRPPHWE